jgi:DNA-binding IclR family transcriptional regulator
LQGHPGKTRTESKMDQKPNISETLEKGLRILDLFSGDESGFTLSEITHRIGVNKTSVYRFLNTLCMMGYLKKDQKSRIYKLGLRTIPLAHSFLQKAEIVQAVKPLVDEIHKQYDLHIDVGICHGDAIYLAYRRESKDTLAFFHFTTGPEMYCLATGKAALAHMEEHELINILNRIKLKPKTIHTITDKETLLDELRQARQRGYVLNKEEFLPGLIAIGAPLFNLYENKVIGGISFDSSTAQYTIEQFEEKFAHLLVGFAKKLSAALTA